MKDGNTSSFEQQGIELIKVLEDKGIKTTSVFYIPSEVKLKHEYQFAMNTEVAVQNFKKITEFLQNIKNTK